MTGFPSPRECPDVRLDMIRDLNPGGSHYDIIRRRCTPDDPLYAWRFSGIDPPEQAAIVQEHLYRTELYWMRSDIVNLITSNTHAIEPSTTLDPTYVPSDYGLVFIETGVTPYGEDLPLFAVSWQANIDRFHINAWVFAEKWFIAGGDYWDHGQHLDDITLEPQDGEKTGVARDHRLFLRRFIVSLFAFLKTPRVVTTDRRPPERHVARRSQRAGIDLNDTHVIYLRTANHATGDGTGLDRYHHRWIVSGHWRSQPYGPQRARRRPIWIMPHLKGPDGAPLLGGDKVRAVIR